ncbi:MAG: hypothetical protein JWN72_1295, partial [Thermoleophilia bacterium]|nr:hypothetical protein [Thermoleophilia bacterium]
PAAAPAPAAAAPPTAAIGFTPDEAPPIAPNIV